MTSTYVDPRIFGYPIPKLRHIPHNNRFFLDFELLQKMQQFIKKSQPNYSILARYRRIKCYLMRGYNNYSRFIHYYSNRRHVKSHTILHLQKIIGREQSMS